MSGVIARHRGRCSALVVMPSNNAGNNAGNKALAIPYNRITDTVIRLAYRKIVTECSTATHSSQWPRPLAMLCLLTVEVRITVE